MMMEAYKEFALLLASAYGEQRQASVVTISVASNPRGSLLLGADPRGIRHVLAECPDIGDLPNILTESLSLSEWRDPMTESRYVDLACEDEGLAQVFSVLADEIAERVATEDRAPHLVLFESLDEWKRLLRPARELSAEKARGLFGELKVLLELGRRNPAVAADLWTGPDGADHDFSSAHGDLEVKTTTAEDLGVVVSSLDQLDPQGSQRLLLVRLRVLETPQGQCLGDVVDELVKFDIRRAAILEKLSRAGFLLGHDIDEHRFVADGAPLVWEVGPDFPGLRRSDIPETRLGSHAVTSVTYRLDLAQAPAPLDAATFGEHLDRMVGR